MCFPPRLPSHPNILHLRLVRRAPPLPMPARVARCPPSVPTALQAPPKRVQLPMPPPPPFVPPKPTPPRPWLSPQHPPQPLDPLASVSSTSQSTPVTGAFGFTSHPRLARPPSCSLRATRRKGSTSCRTVKSATSSWRLSSLTCRRARRCFIWTALQDTRPRWRRWHLEEARRRQDVAVAASLAASLACSRHRRSLRLEWRSALCRPATLPPTHRTRRTTRDADARW